MVIDVVVSIFDVSKRNTSIVNQFCRVINFVSRWQRVDNEKVAVIILNVPFEHVDHVLVIALFAHIHTGLVFYVAL